MSHKPLYTSIEFSTFLSLPHPKPVFKLDFDSLRAIHPRFDLSEIELGNDFGTRP